VRLGLLPSSFHPFTLNSLPLYPCTPSFSYPFPFSSYPSLPFATLSSHPSPPLAPSAILFHRTECKNPSSSSNPSSTRAGSYARPSSYSSTKSTSSKPSCPRSAREVLPRVHGRGRHQQGRKVHPLEVYADEQGEAERIPAFDAGDGYEQCTSFLSPFPFRKRARSRGKGCSRVAHSSSRRAPSFQIRLVFAAVKETILQNALRDSFV
jgi:hypothetical protein